MGMRGHNSATLPRERERMPAQALEHLEWLDELLETPAEASGDSADTSGDSADTSWRGHGARFQAPELPAPERPEWLDFSAYLEAAPRQPATGHGERASTGRPDDGHTPDERLVRSPRDSRAARFARIAQEIRASWGPETTAYATGCHPIAAHDDAPEHKRTTAAPAAERPRRTAAPAQAPLARLAPRPAPVPSVRQRVAQVSRRLAELAASRVIVRIPGHVPRPKAPPVVRSGVGNQMHVAKLPPVWLLANLLILLVAGWTVLPRLANITPESACAWHVVVPGDTLGKLGAAHHTSALAIAHANSLADPNTIYVGERLCIPLAFFASAGAVPFVPAPPQPPHYGPVSGVHAFIQFVLPYARRAHDATGWPTSLILAQWGLEQGWHLPSYTGYNFGNCGAVPGEPTIGGLNVPGSPSAFTYSKTPEDGLRVYVHVAHLSYYTGVAWAAQHGGVDAAARALGASPWDAGHYTDHGDPGSSLIAILHAYNLYQYDA